MNFVLFFLLLSCVLSETNAGTINIRSSAHSVAIYFCGLYKCGGSLISETSVVTVARCVADRLPIHLKVKGGATRIYEEEGQESFVQRKHIHPGYPGKYYYDIAVIKLVTPFNTDTDAVKTIPLYEGNLLPGTWFRVNGWGLTNPHHLNDYPILQTMQVQVMDCAFQQRNRQNELEIIDLVFPAEMSETDFYLVDVGSGGVCNGKLCGVLQSNRNFNFPLLFSNVTSTEVLSFIRMWM